MSALRILAVLTFAAFAATAQAQVENQDYVKLVPAQTPQTKGKVEVIEFFSYMCPHCEALHPLLTKWAAQLPSNAVLVKVPVAFGRRDWGLMVRTYYTLQHTGDLARLDEPLFKAIHKEHQRFSDEDSITAWVAQHGVDAGKFREVFNSFDISTKASRADQLSRDYKINGVPHLTVDGKYSVTGRTYEDMLKIARQLVDKSAAEKQAANR
jgi:thiol:disulfide interchange protein DsbA